MTTYSLTPTGKDLMRTITTSLGSRAKSEAGTLFELWKFGQAKMCGNASTQHESWSCILGQSFAKPHTRSYLQGLLHKQAEWFWLAESSGRSGEALPWAWSFGKSGQLTNLSCQLAAEKSQKTSLLCKMALKSKIANCKMNRATVPCPKSPPFGFSTDSTRPRAC